VYRGDGYQPGRHRDVNRADHTSPEAAPQDQWEPDPWDDNLVAARRDLAAARAAADVVRAELLEALVDCGGSLIVYRPERDHYSVLLGRLEAARHVAVLIPGVGTDMNMRTQWLPAARNLFEAADGTSVILWKAYDEPADVFAAATRTIDCDDGLGTAAADLTEFVRSLPLSSEQTLTLVAHSFGSTVAGAALAHCGLECTDVVVAGSPGLTVDDLRQLHLDDAHFFTEEAPGDPVAGLGVFGTEPTSPVFGGTRMATNAPDHARVRAHSEYFAPGSESLENIVDVVTGRYDRIEAEQVSLAESIGGLVTWALRIPSMPVGVAARHYRGPGFRVLVNIRHLADVTANEAGNAVREGLDSGGRGVVWLEHRFPVLAGMVQAGSGGGCQPSGDTGESP
jgi:pimeloyl-ACP methyl ester carboxylesterase